MGGWSTIYNNTQTALNTHMSRLARLQEQIASGARDKVTVEDIGGLECQKCHY